MSELGVSTTGNKHKTNLWCHKRILFCKKKKIVADFIYTLLFKSFGYSKDIYHVADMLKVILQKHSNLFFIYHTVTSPPLTSNKTASGLPFGILPHNAFLS